MRFADVEKFCLSLAAASVDTPFDDSHVYKVGGKMFAMIAYDGPGKPSEIWFKAGAVSYPILTRVEGIKPCPYLARAQWLAVEGLKVLSDKELKGYLTRAHGIVAAGLSKKLRASLGIAEAASQKIRGDG